MSNPFFQPLPASGIPNFDQIQFSHYREAFNRGFSEHNAEIAAILANPAAPTFENTVEALERSGALLNRVDAVFWNLASSDTDEQMQELERDISGEETQHHNGIYANAALFARVEAVKQQADNLQAEQAQLLAETYQSFVRRGARLSESEKQRVSAISEELAGLQTQFGQNVLQDTNEYELVLEDAEDLAGLPEFVRQAAQAEAESRGHQGKYLFSISRSSITPFLQYADKRELREKMYKAYTQCGISSTDNHALIPQIVRLRTEKAQLLGFESHSEFMLDDRMAGKPEAVHELLDRVWKPCQERVAQEAADLQARIRQEQGDFELEPWDWWYYAEKVRAERFDLSEEEIKPYFLLENVRDGAFDVARKLYGIEFTPRPDLPVYHPDVAAYAVNEADGTLIGYFLFDFFMRPSKRGGAWMSLFRDQSNLDEWQHPVVVNCCNFPKSDPCLLGLDEVRTLFHEFGHGLHGMLSKVRYASLGGTNVKQDFVELPSQIMEHWAMEPQVLKSYARHVETGEAIPDSLISKLQAAEMFNQGFNTTEYVAACYLDMAWHDADVVQGSQQDGQLDVEAFEQQVMQRVNKIGMVDPRYKSSYFQHIFTGESYSAGYYVYLWAEVLDADGYEMFKENGLFDADTASAFRRHILEKGGTEEPMAMYKAFRGRAPAVEPLLVQRGMVAAGATSS